MNSDMQSEFTSCRSTATELAVRNSDSSSGTTSFSELRFTGEVLNFPERPQIHLVQNRDRYFALKQFTPEDAPQPFFHQHPHLVSILSEEKRKDQVSYLLEYVPSTVFLKLILHGAIPEAEALAMFRQVCEAVRHLHAHGVHHGDIRPETVLIDETGSVKLTNLGTSQGLATAKSKAQDVQALARLLHEMLTNEAFQGSLAASLSAPVAALLRRVMANSPPVEALLQEPLVAGESSYETAVLSRLEKFLKPRVKSRVRPRPKRCGRRVSFDFVSRI